MTKSRSVKTQLRNLRGCMLILGFEFGIPAVVNHFVFEGSWFQFGVALAIWVVLLTVGSVLLGGFKDFEKGLTLLGFFWTMPAMIVILLVVSAAGVR